MHWHLGAEHKNNGTFDQPPPNDLHFNGATHRRLSTKEVLHAGHFCPAGASDDTTFTTPYNFQYCKDMTVGYTYEIHWPHSNFGACNTKWQYQSHFMDGAPHSLAPPLASADP